MTKFENKISPRIHVCHDLNTSEMSLKQKNISSVLREMKFLILNQNTNNMYRPAPNILDNL